MLNVGGWGGWALRRGRSCWAGEWRAAELSCLNRKPAEGDGAAIGSYCSRGDRGYPGVGSVTLGGADGTVTVTGEEPDDGGRSLSRGRSWMMAGGRWPRAQEGSSTVTCSFRKFGCENEEDVYGVKKWTYLSLYHEFYKDFTFISFSEILVWLITIEFFSLTAIKWKTEMSRTPAISIVFIYTALRDIRCGTDGVIYRLYHVQVSLWKLIQHFSVSV